MSSRARGASPRWPALAALALALAPALAAAELPDRPNRPVLRLESAGANVETPPHLAVGGRLSLSLERSRVRLMALVEDLQWSVGSPTGDARFRMLAVVGAGIGYAPWSWGTLYGALLYGDQTIAVRDYLHGGWTEGHSQSAVGGVRVGVSLRPSPPRGRFSVRPTVGLALSALWIERETDPAVGISWGGFTPTLTLSFGAELQLPAFGRRPREQDPVPGAEGAPGR